MPPTLKNCISKAGNTLSPEDKKFIQDQTAAGVSDAEIISLLDSRIQNDIGTLATRIQEEGGEVRTEQRLENAPDNVRPVSPTAQAASQEYALRSGMFIKPITEYVPLNTELGTRIADEFEKMKHDPKNPEVKAAYQALIDETMAQFEVIQATGLDIDFTDQYPYATPTEAIDDVNENNHMSVFPTVDGFGAEQEFSGNPLLADSGIEIKGHKLMYNDVFRVVHDYFGHIKHGVGFRAGGEENAWQSHAAMYTPLARRALTTETRGQNSWVNFGPHGEKNRTASGADTIFADQKIGLMPAWTSEEGRLSGEPQSALRLADTDGRNDEGALVRPPTENGMMSVVHFSSKKDLKVIDPKFYGSMGAGVERDRVTESAWIDRTYFGIEPGTPGGYKREVKVGNERYDIQVPAHMVYDMQTDPDNLAAGLEKRTTTEYEKAIHEAGYVGYWVNSPGHGMVGALFEPVTLDTDNKPTVLHQSAVALRDGRETLAKYGLKPGKTYKTREVAAAMEARTREKSGTIARDDRSPAAMQRIARYMVQEVKFEMEHPEHSGVGWYSEKYARALEVMSPMFPELLTDQSARDTMTALVAITSDGQKVVGNFRNAHNIYMNYRETGELVSDTGNYQTNFNGNLTKLKDLFDEHGVEGAHKFLMQEATVSELKKLSPDFNTAYPVNTKLPMAALIFGPKLGAFYGNLMGAHGYLTMDRWWTRTVNRYRGNLLTKPTKAGLDRYRKLVDEKDYTNDQVLAAIIAPQQAYEDRGFWTALEKQRGKKQPSGNAGKAWTKGADPTLLREHEIEKAANTLHKAAFVGLEDRPFNSSDRQFMIDAVKHAQKSLSKGGVEMSIADIQAVLWYYEKRLYGEMGARQTADISYEDAAIAAMQHKEQDQLKLPMEHEDFLVLNQSAYHGTQADVDKFTTEKIGTGEGTAAFGWGMYFAGKRDVADHYRKLGADSAIIEGILNELDEDTSIAEVMELVEAGYENLFTDEQSYILTQLNENDWLGFDRPGQALQAAFYHAEDFPDITPELKAAVASAGNLYEVDLKPKEDEYLLLDEQFDKQPTHLQQKLVTAFGQQPAYFMALEMTGHEMYDKLSRQVGSDHAASMVLLAMGIKGNKFRDAGSRGGAAGTFNYVIFSDDDVAITEQYDQFERGKIFLSDEQRTIQLLGTSDLSSFLHETGHLFLDMEKTYAKKYGNSEDQKAILKWLGLETFDEITVYHHEKWAETFEMYLREGKSPSLGLRRAFAAFSRWLKVIYRSVKDLPNSSLTPEITEVMDRLLASEDEINEAAANPLYDQFFKSKKQAGMSDAEWGNYQANAARVAQTAEMKIDEKAMKQFMQRKTAEWNLEKAPIIEEQKQHLSTNRVYQVYNDLKSYKDDAGTAFEGRLDTALLKAAVGDKLDGRMIGKHVKEGGVDPALVAETYGYASIKQMYDEIVSNPPLKQQAEENAEAIMVDRYGDILNDGSLEQEVREALVNDAQASMLLQEINALNRKNQQPGINRAYLKSQAVTMISSMTYAEIQPDKYYRGMIKAAKATVGSKDPTAAKIQQLSNHYLYKEAIQVKEQMGKNRRKVKGAQGREYDTRKVDANYVQQIKLLSNMYEMRQSPAQQVALNDILNFYVAQKNNAGGELTDMSLLDPNLASALAYREENNGSLAGFSLIQFDDLTADDLQGVSDMLTHLRYVGGQMAEINGEEAIRERLTLAESIRKNGGRDHKIQRGKQGQLESEKRTWNHIVNTMPSLANMVRKMDGNEGGGEAFNMVYQTLVEAEGKKMEMNHQFYNEFEELMGDVSTVDLSRGDSQTFQLESGEQIDFTSEEIFMMTLYWGTESSRDAIMQGWDMSQADVETIMETLSEEQLKLVNAAWAMNESQWPDLSKAAVAMNGVAPPKLKALEFIVNGVQMNGGHMQLMYDSQRIELANEQESAYNTASIMPTKAGSLNARQGSGGMPPLLDIGNITRSVDEKIHYIAYAGAGRRLRGLINHDQIKGAVERKHGPGFYQALVESIEGVTGGRVHRDSHQGFAKAMRWMRTAAVMKHLAFSIRNTVQQVGALPISLKEVGLTRFASASGQFLTQRVKMVEEVNSKSKFMENRAQVVNRESREFMKKLITTSNIGRKWETFKAHGFIFQTAIDSTIAYPTWLGAYNKAMEEHGDEARARTEADTSVAQSVGSGSDMHLGRIMHSSQSEGIKTMTMFGSWFNAYYQRLYKSSKGGDSFINASFAFDALILPFVVANLTQLLILDTPDDDETVGEYMFTNTWQFLAGTVPVMRELGSFVDGFTPSSPINALPKALVDLPNEITAYSEGRQTGLKTLSDVGKAVTGVAKVPGSGELWRSLDYIDSYVSGEEGDTFNIYQMLTEGADKENG